MVEIVMMMWGKLAAIGLLKINEYWNKRYDIIVSDHDVANNILLRDSSYSVGVVVWPKFNNTRFFLTEVIITSILYRSDPKKWFFWEVLLVQFE